MLDSSLRGCATTSPSVHAQHGCVCRWHAPALNSATIADLGLEGAAPAVVKGGARVRRIKRYRAEGRTAAVEVGQHLIAAQEQLGEIEFQRWVAENFGWDGTEAHTYIAIAREAAP